MIRSGLASSRGTVLLVALCFVAVLGISLAGYLAVCSRTMQLSNRTFQTNLSQQLAEMGLEEAMRAFNKNDWSDWSNGTAADWTVSGTTATCNLTFPASKFGQGVTGSVKIRIDNYNAAQLGAAWSSSVTYRINDLIGYNGVWYRCVKDGNLNKNPSTQPSLEWWVQEPIPWKRNTGTYNLGDVINYNGAWYRATGSTTATPPGSNWTLIPTLSMPWNSSTSYTLNSIVYYGGSWYNCYLLGPILNIQPGTLLGVLCWQVNADIAWRWRSGEPYAFNDVVYVNGTWYRCKTAHTSSNGGPNAPPPGGGNWENALSGANTTSDPGVYGWSSSTINYNLGDVVYYSGTNQWYRCIQAHTSNASPTPNNNATCWSNTPAFSTAWDAGKQYNQYDTVRYNGVWYLGSTDANTGNIPPTLPAASGYWVGADTPTGYFRWNNTTAYTAGAIKCYGGIWYSCLVGNTGQSPNNNNYWTPAWAQSSGLTTGAPVVYAEGTINIAGSPSVKTQLRATIAPAPLFPNAVAATTTISTSSGGTVDSYDSDVGAYGGSNIGYSAVIAAGSTSGTAITLSSTTVKGYLAAPSSSTTPFAPLYSSGGTVKGPSSPASPNVDLTRVSRSPYIPKFDTLPSGGLGTNWSTVPKGTALALATTVTIGSPGATTPSRYYYNGNLTIGTATFVNLRIAGPVILYVNGDLTITQSGSTGRIDVSSTGSAEIHVAGVFKADATGEGILSQNTNPKSLIIICDTTSSSDHYYSEGVNPFYGVIYVPNTTSTNGYYNNNTATTIYGAISANKITYSGANLNVHYDTQLRYATFGGVDQPYTITEWRELTGSELATMP